MVNTKSIFGKWDYAIDSSTDGAYFREDPPVGGTTFEIYGIAVKQTADKVYFAINSNLPLKGQRDDRANDGLLGWGDLILNFSGSGLNGANGNLFGIRFADNNESGAASTGLFRDVTAKSVVRKNYPLNDYTLRGYNAYVKRKGGVPSNGDLSADDPYFNLSEEIRNVISSGNRLGGVSFLSAAEMNDLNFSASGKHTFGFAIDRELLPNGEFTMHVAPECGNDVVALTGKLLKPAIDIEKKTNLIDVKAPEEAIALQPGDPVVWTYEVKNIGEIPFTYKQVNVTDDKVAPISLIASSDDKQDGILSPGEMWLYAASGVAEDLSKTSTPIKTKVNLDFETDGAGNPLKAGTFIDDEYQAKYGLTISSLKISDRTKDPNHRTMIFDTANPTGDDDDLGTPNQLYGGPGNSHSDPAEETGNTRPLNNVLIISQDNNPNDPNDKADGGIMRFDWDEPAQLDYIDLLDIDKGDTRNKIRTYDEDGNLIREYSVPAKGNNSLQRIKLGGELASRMEMIFDPSADGSASGAIANISFTQTEYVYKNVGTVKVDGFKGVQDSDASYYRNGEADCICPPLGSLQSNSSNRSTVKDDLLEGTSDADVLRGGYGRDMVTGGSNDDLLWGGKGRDFLYGGGGRDQLRGGAGRSRCWGGSGKDQFVLSPNGMSVIHDFQLSRDAIALKSKVEFKELTILGQGDNTLVQFQDETIAKLQSITPTLITANNFVSI